MFVLSVNIRKFKMSACTLSVVFLLNNYSLNHKIQLLLIASVPAENLTVEQQDKKNTLFNDFLCKAILLVTCNYTPNSKPILSKMV